MIFDSDALSACVSCGLCASSCPTFQVTHAEQHGPRGRIAGMRMVQAGEIEADDAAYVESMETCVQCRACEPACPSGVQFGLLVEQAREALHQTERRRGAGPRAAFRWRLVDAALAVLTSRLALRLASVALSLGQATRVDRMLAARWRVARRIRLRDVMRPLRASTTGARAAFLFRGCVMDAWFRPVHAATVRVLAAAG